jgi:hypothetical protein
MQTPRAVDLLIKENRSWVLGVRFLAVGPSLGSGRIEKHSFPQVNHPPILLGNSSFTATGWQGSFYARGMKPSDYIRILRGTLSYGRGGLDFLRMPHSSHG